MATGSILPIPWVKTHGYDQYVAMATVRGRLRVGADKFFKSYEMRVTDYGHQNSMKSEKQPSAQKKKLPFQTASI